jgi:hypothetical protein
MFVEYVNAIKRIKNFVEHKCEFGLKVNVEITKYMFRIQYQKAGQNCNIEEPKNPAEILETCKCL